MNGTTPPLMKFTPSAQAPEVLEAITVQREALIAKLVEDALDVEGGARHRLLIGPRGMGKTHIVAVVANRVRATEGSDPIAMAWLQEDPWAIGTYEKFLAAILAAVAREASDPDLRRRANELRARRGDEGREAEQALRDAVGAARLVLLVENLDEIFRRIGESGQERFRAFLEDWEQVLILATAPQLFEGIQLHESPFYGFFAITYLDELSLASAVELMRRVARLRGDEELIRFLGDDAARHRLAAVEALAGGHPRVWLLLSGCVSIEAIDELVPLFLEALDELTPYYQDRLRELGDQQQEMIVLLSEAGGALSNRALAERSGIAQNQVATILRQLTERGYVRRAEVPEELAGGDARMSFWELREPLMRLCLDVKQARGEPLRMVVEFLRAWYGPRLLDELAALSPSAELAATYAGEAFRTLDGELPAEDLFRGAPEEILERAELGISLTPERADLRVARACGLTMTDRLSAAREAFEELISAEGPEMAKLVVVLQLLRARETLKGVGVDSLAAGLASMGEEGGSDDLIRDIAGVGLSVLGRHAEALAAFPSAREPGEVESLVSANYLGLSLGQTGRHEEALQAFTRAVELDPDHARLHGNRGLALRLLGRPEEALPALAKAIELSPEEAVFHREAGLALESLGRLEDAVSRFENAVRLQPDDVYSQLSLGITLLKLDRPEEALPAYERAIALGPQEAAQFGHALALRQLGRFADAERAIRRAIELNEDTPIYLFTLAEILFGLGNAEDSFEQLRRGLALWRETGKPDAGDPELICRILWDASSERAARRKLIEEVVAAYEANDAGEYLGRGLVSSIEFIADPEVDVETAEAWAEDWLEARQIDDLEIPMRMVQAARSWKRDRDRSHLLDLPPEQREILVGLLEPS